MSRRVDELRRQLESTHRESQDRVAEVTVAWAMELLAVEWATTAEWEVNTAKVYLAETEVVLQKSLKALDTEQKA